MALSGIIIRNVIMTDIVTHQDKFIKYTLPSPFYRHIYLERVKEKINKGLWTPPPNLEVFEFKHIKVIAKRAILGKSISLVIYIDSDKPILPCYVAKLCNDKNNKEVAWKRNKENDIDKTNFYSVIQILGKHIKEYNNE